MRRRTLLLMGVALAAPAAAQDDPRAPIAALNTAILAGMRAGKATPFAQRYAAMRRVIDRAFDLPAILAVVVGPRWAGLPPAQQARLLGAFSAFTVASYVGSFDSFSNETLELLPDLRPVGQDQVVATRLTPASAAPVRLDYVMRRTPSGWRAVDVLLDGTISRVAVQRSDFRSLVTTGDASALIESLNRKVADLSGGAVPAS